MKLTLGSGRLGKVLRISAAALLMIQLQLYISIHLQPQKLRPQAARNAPRNLVAALSLRVGPMPIGGIWRLFWRCSRLDSSLEAVYYDS